MRRPRVPPRAFRITAATTLVALVAIVLTGGAVRLTGSGLGCTDWPLCEGVLVKVDASTYHPLIESGNRFVTELAGVLIVVLFVFALLRSPRRRDLTWLAAALGVTYLLNGVLGALVVHLQLAPVSVIGHFVLAEACVALGYLLWRRAGLPDAVDGVLHLVPDPRAGTVTRRLTWLLTGLTVWVMLLGTVVTSSGPHAGDPSAVRLTFGLTEVARVHSVSALCTLGVLAYMFWHLRREPAAARMRAPLVCFAVVVVLQGIVGYAQFFAGVPPLLVGVHLLGATLVWLAALAVVCSLDPPVPVRRDGRGVDVGSGRSHELSRRQVAA